jgi:hypothetical protein
MSEHYKYHYSVTIETKDEVVLHCLRAISQYAQMEGHKQIAWGGTNKEDWLQNHYRATFHFSKPEYRVTFKYEASRLMPRTLWRVICESDNDPATRQR